MSDTYLIPQFIVDYLQKSRSTKNPKILASKLIKKNLTSEIEQWFKGNEVNARYLWKFFISKGKKEFDYKTCAVCGKRIKIESLLSHHNTKYCSLKCATNSKEVQEKITKTNLVKYGAKCTLQSKAIREKRKHTWLENYGVEHPFQSKEVQEKKKETMLKRYGVEYPSQSKEIKEKAEENRKQTCLVKYGVEHPPQSKEVQEKIKQIKRSNHWETFCSLLKEKDIVPLFDKEEYINDTGRKFKCLYCNEEFESEGTCNYNKKHKNKDGSYKTLQMGSIFCPRCRKVNVSKKEKEVLSFCKTIYDGIIEENKKSIFAENGRFEMDIFLPSENKAIEFDGNYWHSTDETKEKDKQKNELCKKHNIKLLRIKESDWDTNPDKIKEEIKYFLGEGK